jgi:beta-1,4-mannosyl-glycoprotein beta-1,4-N-acetylglucosaminyltransferase
VTPKVFDCFTFMNEFDLLELRLHELDRVVDYFVLAEATRTHRGTHKPLYFAENKTRFAAFLKKIIHVVVDDLPAGGESEPERWARERFQRESLLRGLVNARSDDFVIISDLDEIPRASAVEFVTRQRPLIPTRFTFEMRMYWYYLNLQHPELWIRSSMSRSARVRNPEIIRMWGLPWTTPANPLKRWRKTIKNFHAPLRLVTIPDAGWHFTFMGGHEAVRQKLTNYPHVASERQLTDAAVAWRIDKAVASARKASDTQSFRVCRIDDSFPVYLRENLDKYRHMILPDVTTLE